MIWIYLLVLGPMVAGLIVAVVWWLIRGRHTSLPRDTAGASSAGASPVTAGLILILGGIPTLFMAGIQFFHLNLANEYWEWHRDYRFTIPLLLGILGMAVLAFPIQPRGGQGSADLRPRTPVSFTSRFWLLTPAVVVVCILTLTIAAGSASDPDTTGRYNMYFVDMGEGASAGTTIYGWFYSLPCLILLAVLAALAAVNLFLIARPALHHDRERDVHTRTARSRAVLMVGTGALLWHLGDILNSLAGTASLRGSFDTSEGNVGFWTTFAALEPALTVASLIAVALGFVSWFIGALAVIPERQREAATARS